MSADGALWPIRSPGLATDVALLRLQGSEVSAGCGYAVVRTPANPTYHWGNCLILQHAPEPGSLAEWADVFARAHPGAEHVAIGIDDPDAAISPDEAALVGLTIEGDIVLSSGSMAPGPPVDGYRLATVDPEDAGAWDALVTLELADLGADVSAEAREAMAVFRTRRYAGHRELARAGVGQWWAAYSAGGTPVATLGLFGLADGLARYQDVLTHPDHRRRGLAGALVRAAGCAQLARGSRQLVIVADPSGPAIGTYRRAGLSDLTRQWALYRPPVG